MDKVPKPEFLDKVILEKRREKLKEAYATLESGVFMQGEIMTFERREILDLFSLMLPTSFNVMDERLKTVKYTGKFAPSLVLSSEDLSTDLGFSEFVDHKPKESVTQMAQDVKEVLEGNPFTFDFQEIVSLKDVEGCYFQFFQTTLDTDMFHIMAFVRMSGQMMHISFNCVSDLDTMMWETTVVQMLESIKNYEKRK